MNTRKQVNVMLGLMFVSLVGLTLYFVWDPERAEQAEIRQEQTNAERGAHLYSLNCRSCHGLTGQGALERAGLPGAPLNVEANRPPELTAGALDAAHKRFYDTIFCGRVGTVMPPWAIEQGGALNFFQIEQLVTLITSQFSEEAWAFAVHDANHADAYAPAVHLTEAIGADDTTVALNYTTNLKKGDLIRIGGDDVDQPYEVLKVGAIDEEGLSAEVERGVEGSEALEHEAGAEVYKGPILPGTTITGDPGAQGFPPCGQKAAPAAATPTPGGGGAAEGVSLNEGGTITMGDNFFEFEGQQNPTFTLSVGNTAGVTITNSGSAIHNLRTSGDDASFDTRDDHISDPETVAGGEEGTLEISFQAAGTYDYRCDFHPEMAGKINVQ
jgi:plastocyanin/mono/diheme cytochrome c family protein